MSALPEKTIDVPPSYTTEATPPTSNEDARLAAFADLVARHEISRLMAMKLRRLEAYDIAVIADDSGSMNTPSTQGQTDPFARSKTRWDELKSTLAIVTDIAATLDEDGIDVYFLNRPPVRNVTGMNAALESAFAQKPAGYTPITRVLRQVIREKWTREGKKLLILIATDGQPTTDSGELDKHGLKHLLMHERGGKGEIPIAFLVCTDDDSEVDYLNEWDTSIQDLDVIDDYITEKKQILRVQGNGFPFSRGDWVCKMLLGVIDAEIDGLDERRVGSANVGRGETARTNTSSGGKKDCVIQ
ncbi:hypothetical protein BCR33DRAFT_711003 [Rhizoclosmatium globosum]|uniref:VWFA domain-containing protein n=1 Tax=Rhizoclosmatium globosum TaxID=329046 RepID=A0A1Y2D3C8_9FUNG|nr:hypothetical protein BCR33DRAFT_711003 [Rhizoclosmatium globosum]|eukprot:ORY53616.1 hypothetical protein BCR33DRAFT_711003 [Rhizoclosmatium globosum]